MELSKRRVLFANALASRFHRKRVIKEPRKVIVITLFFVFFIYRDSLEVYDKIKNSYDYYSNDDVRMLFFLLNLRKRM